MQIVEAEPVERQRTEQERREIATRALEFWFAVREIGLIDAVAWFSIGAGEAAVGPEERAISQAAKDWVKSHESIRTTADARIIELIAGRATS